MPSLADRLELVASGAEVTDGELKDLAEYGGEIDDHTNELGTKFADFAADVQMLLDPATPEEDRKGLRAALTADAEAAVSALRCLAGLSEPPPNQGPVTVEAGLPRSSDRGRPAESKTRKW